MRELEGQRVLFNKERHVIYEEQLFDVLHRVHVEETGHGGRDAMRDALKGKFGIGK